MHYTILKRGVNALSASIPWKYTDNMLHLFYFLDVDFMNLKQLLVLFRSVISKFFLLLCFPLEYNETMKNHFHGHRHILGVLFVKTYLIKVLWQASFAHKSL